MRRFFVIAIFLMVSKASAQGTAGITIVGCTAVGCTGSGSNYTISPADSTVYCNNTTNAPFALNLPQASKYGNRVLEIKKIDTGSFPCEIIPNGTDTIDGATSPIPPPTGPGFWLTSQPNPTPTLGPPALVPSYMSRKLQSDGVSNWSVLSGVTGTSTFGRCIPAGDVAIPAGNNTSICTAVLPCYPFDPGIGNTYMSIGLSQLVFTYSGATPSSVLTTLQTSCAGFTNADGHGSNYIGVSPVTMPVVGAVDDATARNDPLNPANKWCPLATECISSGVPYACCDGGSNSACKGGCQVSLFVEPQGNGITVKKGPGVLGNGADTAILIEDKMHFNMGK